MSNKKTPRRAKKRPPAPPPLRDLPFDRRRLWLRNIPLLVGLFATYLFTIGPLQAQAAAGILPVSTALRYALVGVMGIIGSLMVYKRYWATRLQALPDTGAARVFYLLGEVIVYLLAGVGIGMLMMAVMILTLRRMVV